MAKVLKFYRTTWGKIPFLKWHSKLPIDTQTKIEQRINRLVFGENLGDYKFIQGGVCELRLHFGAGFRIYFAEYGETIILLLCGGDKSSQEKDIKNACQYWLDFKRRNYE